MPDPLLGLAELLSLARARRLSSVFGAAREQPVVVVELGTPVDADAAVVGAGEIGTLPVVLVGIGPADHPNIGVVDVVAEDAAGAEVLAAAVHERPLASTALALLLRHDGERSITSGLVAESTAYSLLQAGPEFAAWRAGRAPRPSPPGTAEREVIVDRDDDSITLTLNRPHRRNAVNAALSELLVEALTEALAEPDRRVVLRGNGPSFSSGGDLDEFGSFPSPVHAHGIRLLRSAGHLISLLADRVEVHLHGACMGAGIELPAFAGTVIAAPNTVVALPELSLGLVPGAGGTVSLPRRIGRHRTARLALTGERIDAPTALAWGLVDRVVDEPDV